MPSLDKRMRDFQKGYPVRFYIKRESERTCWKLLRDQINALGMEFSALYDRRYEILFIFRKNMEVPGGSPDETAEIATTTPGGPELAGRNPTAAD